VEVVEPVGDHVRTLVAVAGARWGSTASARRVVHVPLLPHICVNTQLQR